MKKNLILSIVFLVFAILIYFIFLLISRALTRDDYIIFTPADKTKSILLNIPEFASIYFVAKGIKTNKDERISIILKNVTSNITIILQGETINNGDISFPSLNTCEEEKFMNAAISILPGKYLLTFDKQYDTDIAPHSKLLMYGTHIWRRRAGEKEYLPYNVILDEKNVDDSSNQTK